MRTQPRNGGSEQAMGRECSELGNLYDSVRTGVDVQITKRGNVRAKGVLGLRNGAADHGLIFMDVHPSHIRRFIVEVHLNLEGPRAIPGASTAGPGGQCCMERSDSPRKSPRTTLYLLLIWRALIRRVLVIYHEEVSVR